jgi:UDP-GlcNAc:undecaprenyl-phosphate GlcNAc-1-phosphate transferase
MVLSAGASAAISAGAVALSIVFFIGIPSAVNLVDGHDGLAAGTSLISAAAFAAIAAALGADILIVGSLAVVGACAGFLVYNFPPGTIYMGDTGSMFLGTMLAVIACLITTTAPSFLTFTAVCLVLGVPALDAVLAVARRLSLRSPVFGADSLHMHHVLAQAGFSPRQVLGVIWSLQAVLAALGVATAFGLVFAAVAGCMVLLSAFVWFFRQMVAARPVGGRVAPDVSPGSIPLRGDRAVEFGQRGTVGR